MADKGESRRAWKRIAIYALVPLAAALAMLLFDKPAKTTHSNTRHSPMSKEQVKWRQGKPAPGLGLVEAAVTERIAEDRVRISVRVHPQPNTGCRLELVLPLGCDIHEGKQVEDVSADALIERTWVVQFPTDRTLDAVVRYCANVGTGVHATEVPLRMVTAE